MSINKDVNLFNKKIIYDITPFSHLDYPDHLSCIIWFCGCDLRCQYCYNDDIVFAQNGKYSIYNTLSFLDKRKGLLDAVVLSGGEATRYNLIELCKEIKKRSFKIKLDTSGVNFNIIKKLIDLNLLDYIALDYKAPKYKYKEITQSTLNKYSQFELTLNYLIKTKFTFEVRTTWHTDLLDTKDIQNIIIDLEEKNYIGKYFIQRFILTKSNISNINIPIKQPDLDIFQDNNDNISIEYRNF